MYIKQAHTGFNEGWKYLVGSIGIFFGSQFIGGLPFIIIVFMEMAEKGITITDQREMFALVEPNFLLFLMLLPFVIGFIMLLYWVKKMHKQTITSLTTSRKAISWKRIVFSFLLWGGITVLLTTLDYQMNPSDYQWNLQWDKFIGLAIIALLLVPLQTSFEEYLFRGYLMQGLGLVSGNRLLPLIFTSCAFGLLHIFNPEVSKMGYIILVYYIGTGFFLGIVTLMDEGLELALGFHAANNLITALLVTADWTVFQTNSILKDVSEPAAGVDVLIPVFVIFPILLLVFAKVYKWNNWKARLSGKVLIDHNDRVTKETL